jgi:hypothetical protein
MVEARGAALGLGVGGRGEEDPGRRGQRRPYHPHPEGDDHR